MFYDILKGEDNLQFNGQALLLGAANLFFNPLAGNPAGPVNYLSNPFVAAGIPNPFPSKPPARNIDFGAAGLLPFGGNSVYFVDPHLRTPYVYDYSFSLQQELAHSLIAEVTYVGSSAHGLTALVDQNPIVLGTNNRLINSQYGLTANNGFSYLSTFENIADQSYNGLEASLTKRFSDSRAVGNTFFTIAYTLSHSSLMNKLPDSWQRQLCRALL